MSGGHWEYIQYQVNSVADDIEAMVEKSGKLKTKEELKWESWKGEDWYEKYPEDIYHYKFPDEVIEEFKNAAKIIKAASIYIQRIDWLVCGDDGDESFIKRLKEDLEKENLLSVKYTFNG